MKLRYPWVMLKIKNVYFSCKNAEQLKIAKKYCDLLTKQYLKQASKRGYV